MDIAILTKFAQSIGVTLKVNPMQFSASIQGVSSKRYDITANIYKTPTREKAIQFSEPVIWYQEGIIVNSQ